jgi:hypothetical protein
VQFRHPGEAVEEVDVGGHEPMGTGDEINTDETGLGILTFADFLRVEIFRRTGLQVKAAPDPDAPPIVKLYLALGTTIQELQEQAGERVVVTTETDWATITSVSTKYLISVDEDGGTSVVVYKGEARVEAQQKAVILQPGQATYVEPRQAPQPPTEAEIAAVDAWADGARAAEEVGSIKPVIFPAATPTPMSTPTATRTPTATPTATPTPKPADVRLISDLHITNLKPFVEESVKATFKVRNYGEQPFTARYFGVKGRGSGSSLQDFLWIEDVSIAPGAEYAYSSSRSFAAPGEYWFTPHYSPDGVNWLDITWPDGRVSYVYSTVVRDNPPLVEGVYVEPATISQGDEFSIKLTASDDFGLQSIRWRIEGAQNAYFDQGDEASCGGITWCELNWSLKWTGNKDGQFVVYAQALDTAGQLSSAGSATINVLSPADLIVQSIDRIDVSCVSGSCTTTVVFTIANVGKASAGAFKVLISADPGLEQQKVVGVNGLEAGATMTLQESLPSGGNCYDPNCTVCVTVNSGGYVVESNEGNNELCETWPG